MADIETIITVLTLIFAALTFVFCLRTFFNLKKKKTTDVTERIRALIFIITTGFLIWTAAEFTYTYIQYFEESEPGSLSDLFWIIGYLFTIPGFTGICIYAFTKTKELFEETLKLAATITAALFVLIFILTNLVGTIPEETNPFFIYVYPIASLILMIVSGTAAKWFQKTNISTPFLILAAGFVFDFLGDLLYFSAEAQPAEWLVPYSDTGYLIGYACSATAFYMLSKRGKQ
ncbi:hypothetical protein J4219_08635 [Candidatus Woesearchaeota archaeon]|nr:hypothetical protein [Candidatus Woesearchaeota archaeon]